MSSEQRSSQINHITLIALWQTILINISVQNTNFAFFTFLVLQQQPLDVYFVAPVVNQMIDKRRNGRKNIEAVR